MIKNMKNMKYFFISILLFTLFTTAQATFYRIVLKIPTVCDYLYAT